MMTIIDLGYIILLCKVEEKKFKLIVENFGIFALTET